MVVTAVLSIEQHEEADGAKQIGDRARMGSNTVHPLHHSESLTLSYDIWI